MLDSLRPSKGVKGRVADEDTAEDAANSDADAASAIPAKEPEIAMTPELLELRSKLRECLAYYYFRPENVAIRSLSERSAIMTGKFILSGGTEAEQSGWFTLIWVRTATGWRVVHDHTS